MEQEKQTPLTITETRESDFDRELHVSVFDYLADAYLAGKISLDEVQLTFNEIEDMHAEVDGRDD